MVEVLSNVFNLMHNENPLNLVYVTHCSHDAEIAWALNALHYYEGDWQTAEPIPFNSSLRFEVVA